MTVANLVAGLRVLGQFGLDPMPVDVDALWLMVPVTKGTVPAPQRLQLYKLGWKAWWLLKALPSSYVNDNTDFTGTWRVKL